MSKEVQETNPNLKIDKLMELALKGTSELPGFQMTIEETRRYWFRCGWRKAVASMKAGLIVVFEDGK